MQKFQMPIATPPDALPVMSVVTPSFQQLGFLRACVASVEMQAYPHVEHLVLDGGSTDGTKAYLETAPGCVTWWRSHADGGQSQALNEGFKKAAGEWIGWQNSDDFYYPGAFWRVADIAVQHPEAGVIVGDTVVVNGKGIMQYTVGVSPVPAKLWLQGYWPYNQAVFFRRDFLRQALPVDESLHLHMDTDFLAKIALLEPKVAYINVPLGAFRKYEGTKTETVSERSLQERKLLCERYQQRMWPEEGWQWQMHRVKHHFKILCVWGWKAFIQRFGKRLGQRVDREWIMR